MVVPVSAGYELLSFREGAVLSLRVESKVLTFYTGVSFRLTRSLLILFTLFCFNNIEIIK